MPRSRLSGPHRIVAVMLRFPIWEVERVYVGLSDPEVGMIVGEYKLVKLLGWGGLGLVFKVEREGGFYAMKFLRVPKLDGRARREISILTHLDHPCVVHYVGSDFWPNPVWGYPYIVMEYVPGDTLEAFALKHNPSARKATRIVLDIARTLGEVHQEGVFHRDLKPTNIILRGASEHPVLIDFGIGALAGASCLTGTSLPPATEEFRAPEPLRFERDNPGGTAQYEYATPDELWALGVTYYWLLTDVLPFGERRGHGGLSGLRERILSSRPAAPHLLNPRVPRAASEVCMTMLAEWPGERYATVEALCAALQGALTQAEHDPPWDAPLVDPHHPQLTTTLEVPELREPDEELRDYRKDGKRQPRRGWVHPDEAPALPVLAAQVAPPRPPVAEPEDNRLPPVDAPREGVPRGEHMPPAVAVPPGREPFALAPAAHPRRSRWVLGLVAALAAVAVMGVSVSAWGPGPSSRTGRDGTELTLPSGSPRPRSTGGSVAGHEVAPAPKPLEPLAGEGAAPVGAPPPAPTAHAMPRTPAQTKKHETPTPRAGLRLPVKPKFVAAAATLSCSLVEGCTGSTTQVRPTPAPVECPADWKAGHQRLGKELLNRSVVLPGYEGVPGETAPLREGPVTVALGGHAKGRVPEGPSLYGKLQLGEGRFYGTFTQAQIAGGDAFPVCLVIGAVYPAAMTSGPDCPVGLGFCPAPESKPGNWKTYTRIPVHEKGDCYEGGCF